MGLSPLCLMADPSCLLLSHCMSRPCSPPRDAESEDGDYMRFDKAYRNLSLLITTGPGPVPSLDGENIVVGQVTGECGRGPRL